MRPSRKRLCSALALGALAAATSSAVFGRNVSSDSFSGVWHVNVEPDSSAQQSGKQEFNDDVLFEDGKMTAAACASYGFGESTYSVSGNGLSMSSTMSTNGESIVWTANLINGTLQGTVTWTKADGHVYHYVLHGSRSLDNDSGDSSSGTSG